MKSISLNVPPPIKNVFRYWRTIFVILVPLISLPLALNTAEDKNGKDITQALQCSYVMLNMAAFWVTEALPLAVTSLIPVILLPIFGIMTTDAVCKEYMKETNMMFISGLVIAIAVEHCNLHKRVALKFLLFVGTSPRRLMLGFMLPTMFLSMWISNTATTAMMVPIVEAVLFELEKDSDERQMVNAGAIESNPLPKEKSINIRHMIFLSIAYAANSGGTGTLTGTGSNLILKGTLAEFGSSPINFATWMGYATVPMLVNLILCWLWLQMFYIGIPWKTLFKKTDGDELRVQNEKSIHIRNIIKEHQDKLGPMNFHEVSVLILFIILILLWLLREPQFIVGWGEFFKTSVKEYVPLIKNCTDNCTYTSKTIIKDSVDDATAGMAIVILLFIIPRQFKWNRQNSESSEAPESLINWPIIQKKIPWDLVFLVGGGFALSKGTTLSGLSSFLGVQLESLNSLPAWCIVVIVCVGTATATEITSNVATCSIILPVLKNLAISLRINPIYLMLPVTLCCSYAFMLPVATPPNAIVYKASGMKTSEMIKVGFGMNIICIVTNILWLQSFGIYFFNLNEFPEWAEPRKAI